MSKNIAKANTTVSSANSANSVTTATASGLEGASQYQMSARQTAQFKVKYLVIALVSSLTLSAYANDANTSANNALANTSITTNTATTLSAPEGERMGEWLSQQLDQVFVSYANADAMGNATIKDSLYYEPALAWEAHVEVAPQQAQRENLNLQLTQFIANQPIYHTSGNRVTNAINNGISSTKNKVNTQISRHITGNDNNRASVTALQQWLASLPATGRVVLPKQDASYLQVNPEVDPVFKKNDKVVLHQQPHTVTVLFDDASACRVSYQAGVRAKDYIAECQLKLQKKFVSDEAYLISADGSVERLTIGNWNQQQQQAPAPGSWLWVPSASNKWPEQLAQSVAQFIGTQGVDLLLPFGQDETPLTLSQAQLETARDLPVTPSDWGITGLLQTPTARMQEAGNLTAHVSHVDPYTQYNIVLQPFDRLETVVRYTSISGVSYGPVSPNQDLKDKSLDVKLKLLNESKWVPQLAVGWRDPAGTGLFDGEYLVANKRYGDFDFSLGMGWGYLGARGDLKNPLGIIDNRFKDRVAAKRGQGGDVSPKSWFTGKASVFGGVQWHSPYDPLTVKVEYDGNDYQSEPHSNKNHNPKDFPVNVGVTWQDKKRGLVLSGGLERGDTLMLGVSLQGDMSGLGRVKPKAQQTQYVESLPKTSYSSLSYKADFTPSVSGKWGDTITEWVDKSKHQLNLNQNRWGQPNIGRDLTESAKIELSKNAPLLNAFSQATGWRATDLAFENDRVFINVDDYGGVFIKERLKQGMEILRQGLPADISLVQIQVSRYGEPVSVFNIDPATWQEQYLQLTPPSQRIEQPVAITSAAQSYQPNTDKLIAHVDVPKASLSIFPSVSQSIGGPDGYLYGIFANASADYRLWQGAWISGQAQLRLLDNYDKFSYTADSKLPRVRTHVGEYMTNSRILMPNLQLNQFKSFGNNLYGMAYAGYLESMYAGVGGELLYRKPNQPWAVGIDLNRVRKRDFDQHFGFRDYEVNTGHVSLYWDTPLYDIDMKLSAGQYLAGDKGATLDLSRTFGNGVKMGGWLTKTNVSAEEFGEGSMDKGVYVSIPLDTLFPQWTSGQTSLVYQPLIRDGGAKLQRRYNLYDFTSSLDNAALEKQNPMEHY
ncbi:YjbH domain-containing protein [Psychrobacter lutiphocae]|uniref:YjbH domain-containing protein n=1 Tax=Psychrobacter lutiphocae TaxID=540500 RepID=UPI00035C9D4D|nr:YjbH domain-containing protein [Psychrobacter lutiphocae]